MKLFVLTTLLSTVTFGESPRLIRHLLSDSSIHECPPSGDPRCHSNSNGVLKCDYWDPTNYMISSCVPLVTHCPYKCRHYTQKHECIDTDSYCSRDSNSVLKCAPGYISSCGDNLTADCMKNCLRKIVHHCPGPADDANCKSISGLNKCNDGYISSCNSLHTDCNKPCVKGEFIHTVANTGVKYCLSIGSYTKSSVGHSLLSKEKNVFWRPVSDNKCIGWTFIDGKIETVYDDTKYGITYSNVLDEGLGIDSTERNLKITPQINDIKKMYIKTISGPSAGTYAGKYICSTDPRPGYEWNGCCMEWGAQYVNGWTSDNSNGRVAKLDCWSGGDKIESNLIN